MKALLYLGNGKLELGEVPTPVPAEGEVLVRVCCSALCGSERSRYLADGPTIPNTGHEYTGIIEDPNGTHWKKGDRVAIHVTYGCGECYYCKHGMQQFCKDMHIIFGGHAEFVAVPARACVPLPDDMSQQEAVLLCADTVGVAYRASKRIHGKPGTPVLVTGAGPIGLGVTTLLKHLGYYVVVSEPVAFRRTYAEKLGADLTIDPSTQDLAAELSKITDGLGVEYVLECSGNGQVEEQCLDLVRCSGTVVFLGENEGTIPVSPSGHFTRKEILLTGVLYLADGDFAEITELFRNGLNVLPLISHSVTPEECVEAAHLFFAGKTAKVVINWHNEK